MNMIKNACLAMNKNGFEGYYHSLVRHFIATQTMNYRQFAKRTCRATLPLQNQKEAVFYSVAYGLAHYKTFLQVLEYNLSIEASDEVLNIIDYGCGQGIATLATLAHIRSQKPTGDILVNVHLIEPSAVSLGNAVYTIQALAQALNIRIVISTQNCLLQNAIIPTIDNGYDILHLMSYILDVPAVQTQLPTITQQIQRMAGINHIIASTVNRPDGYDGFRQLSYLLTRRYQRFDYYRAKHNTYRVIQGNYEQITSNAIGMMISLDGLPLDKTA